MQKLISVALDVPINKLFDYQCDDKNAKAGARVRVPFGNSTRIGLIVQISQAKVGGSKYQIKKIYELLDHFPILSAELMKTLRWAATYYHHPIGQVLFNALSPVHRNGKSEPKSQYRNRELIEPTPLILNDEQLKISNSI